MLPDWVSNPGPLTYESGALPIALHSPANSLDEIHLTRGLTPHLLSVIIKGEYCSLALPMNDDNLVISLTYDVAPH